MAFEKKGGKNISKQLAMTMIENFHKDKKDHVRSIYYDKEMLHALISTTGCVGVQIYFAAGDTGPTLVLMPVDENNRVIDGESTILDVGNPCPPYC
jgi:hypothetical protein